MYSATINKQTESDHSFNGYVNPHSPTTLKWVSACSCGWVWTFEGTNAVLIHCKDINVAIDRWTTKHLEELALL
jgi:hypothetical protein